MKLSLFVVILLFLVPSTSNAQASRTIWTQFGCAPGAKSARQEIANFIDKEGNFEEQERTLLAIITFSRDGFKATAEYFQLDGSPREKMIYSHDTAKNQGRIEFYDNQGSLKSYMVKIYEPNGRESEQITYDKHGVMLGKTVFTVGLNGASETLSYNAAGIENGRSVSTYSSANGAGELDTTDYDAAGNVSGKSNIVYAGDRQYETDQHIRTEQPAKNGGSPTNNTATVKSFIDLSFDSRHSQVKSFGWLWNPKTQAYRPFMVSYSTITYY